MTVFKNPNDPENVVVISMIKTWVKEKIAAEAAIDVIEIDCADPGCIDKSTRIVVVDSKGATVAFSIHKPLVFVRKADVVNVLTNYGN